MKRVFIILCAVFITNNIVLANEFSTYFDIGYHLGKYKEDVSGTPSFEPNAIKIGIGKFLNENIAIEGQFAIGLGEDTDQYQGIDIDVEIENAISIFLKGNLNLSEKANLYGLVGFTKGKLKAKTDALGEDYSSSDSGLSYGLGVDVCVVNNISLRGDYIFYLSEDDYDYSGFNLSVMFKI